MDFSKLGSNERLAVYGSIAVVIGGLVGLGAAGLGLIAVLAALGMLVVVFLPQMSPSTNLPGSKGSLMLGLGAVAAIILILGFLTVLGALGILLQFSFVGTLFYLIAVAGGILMAWAGWQEFQAEGGKFQLGTAAPNSARPSGAPNAPVNQADTAGGTNTATPVAADRQPDAATRADVHDDHDQGDRPTV